jgi:hypothetical protein
MILSNSQNSMHLYVDFLLSAIPLGCRYLSRTKLCNKDVIVHRPYRVIFEPYCLTPLRHPLDIATVDYRISKTTAVDLPFACLNAL